MRRWLTRTACASGTRSPARPSGCGWRSRGRGCTPTCATPSAGRGRGPAPDPRACCRGCASTGCRTCCEPRPRVRGGRRAVVARGRHRLRRAQLGRRLPARVVVGRGARLPGRRPGDRRLRRRAGDRARCGRRRSSRTSAGASCGSANRCWRGVVARGPGARPLGAARPFARHGWRSRPPPTRSAAHVLDVPVPGERRTVPWSHQHLAGRLRVRVTRRGGALVYEGESDAGRARARPRAGDELQRRS